MFECYSVSFWLRYIYDLTIPTYLYTLPAPAARRLHLFFLDTERSYEYIASDFIPPSVASRLASRLLGEDVYTRLRIWFETAKRKLGTSVVYVRWDAFSPKDVCALNRRLFSMYGDRLGVKPGPVRESCLYSSLDAFLAATFSSERVAMLSRGVNPFTAIVARRPVDILCEVRVFFSKGRLLGAVDQGLVRKEALCDRRQLLRAVALAVEAYARTPYTSATIDVVVCKEGVYVVDVNPPVEAKVTDPIVNDAEWWLSRREPVIVYAGDGGAVTEAIGSGLKTV